MSQHNRSRRNRYKKRRRQNRNNKHGDVSSEYVPPPRLLKQQALDMAQQYNQQQFIKGNQVPLLRAEPMSIINNKRRQSYSDEDEESTFSLMTTSTSMSNRSDNIYVHNNNRKNTVYYQQKAVPQSLPTISIDLKSSQQQQQPQVQLREINPMIDNDFTIDSSQFELDLRKTTNAHTPVSAASSESPALFPINGYNLQQQHNHHMNMMNNQNMAISPPNAFLFPPPAPYNMYNNNYNASPPFPMQQQEGECFVCIDVECAATGYGHFDSAPCRIAMVDFFGDVLFDKIANVPNLVDPLSEFTGLTKWEIQNKGDSLQNVLSEFHDLLISLNKEYRYGVTIIGQSVIMDIIWTALVPNIHYQRVIDIAHCFKTKNAKWDSFTFYSLRQVAWALLDCQMNTEFHDPTEDAGVTIKLWRDFCLDPERLRAAQNCLRKLKSFNFNHFPDFQVHTEFDQCSAMYNPSKCTCGQKTAVHIDGLKDTEKLRDLYLEHRSKPVLYDTINTFELD